MIVAIVACALTVVVQLVTAAYVYGRLTEKVNNFERRLEVLEEKL